MTNIIKTKTMTVDAVMDIFYEQAERTDLALNCLPGGICFAKTHIICEDLINKGLSPKKAWAFEYLAQKLWIEGHPQFTEEIQLSRDWWFYHVAPVLTAQDKNRNKIDLILDPCLFDAPVTKEQWMKTIHASPDHTFILEHKETIPGYGGNYTPTKKMKKKSYKKSKKEIIDLERALKHRNKKMPEKRIVFKSDFRKAFEKASKVKLPKSGKTWERISQFQHLEQKP